MPWKKEAEENAGGVPEGPLHLGTVYREVT
jgi:hypothetical protein